MPHCCESMRYHVDYTCDVHSDRHNCPNCLVAYHPVSDTYGLLIHDGGTATIAIQFCPWCGIRLGTGGRRGEDG